MASGAELLRYNVVSEAWRAPPSGSLLPPSELCARNSCQMLLNEWHFCAFWWHFLGLLLTLISSPHKPRGEPPIRPRGRQSVGRTSPWTTKGARATARRPHGVTLLLPAPRIHRTHPARRHGGREALCGDALARPRHLLAHRFRRQPAAAARGYVLSRSRDNSTPRPRAGDADQQRTSDARRRPPARR